jgi:hypothetical protein
LALLEAQTIWGGSKIYSTMRNIGKEDSNHATDTSLETKQKDAQSGTSSYL